MISSMTRGLAVLPLVLLVAACGTSGGAATTTRTVTRTVTAAPTAPGSVSDPGEASIPGDATGGSGSATPAAAADAAPDACSVLTHAQAEKVASTPLLAPTGAGKNSAGRFVMCQWIGPTSGPTVELEVYIGDGAQQQLHIDKDNLKHTFTSVPGVGDQCLQEDGFIFVEKNGLWASIHLVRLNDPKLNVKPMQVGIRELAARLP